MVRILNNYEFYDNQHRTCIYCGFCCLNDVFTTFNALNSSFTCFSPIPHGAITELARPEGILSVTSLNQLVHNPSFSITEGDICTLFGNIYPLLEAIN